MRGAGSSPMPESTSIAGRHPPAPSEMDPNTPAAAAKARREAVDDGTTF